ncbi:hypothetical protein [Romboutsia ilealis]|uniref:hypothetical protein n=1 Tax=Romboutsia ilealis TaxID=1115758 RepID=UPI00272CCD19|nr:hypothetical protein [Romboutsia ilealis]
MYRHTAESIKESNDKQFVSLEDKRVWNNKAEGNHNHDERYYTKEEIDSKFDFIENEVQGTVCESSSTSGHILDLELIGNTIRRGESLVSVCDDEKTLTGYPLKLKSHNLNMIHISDFVQGAILNNGEDTNWVEYFKTLDYIPVNPGSVLNGGCIYTQLGVCEFSIVSYDENKKFINRTIYRPNSDNNIIVNISENTYYIRVVIYSGEKTGTLASIERIQDLYLSEQKRNSKYIDPLHDHVNILLPTSLEGLLNIKDRLFRDSDGKIKIEKRIKTLTPTNEQLADLIIHKNQDYPTSIFTMINIKSLFIETPYAIQWKDIMSNLFPTNAAWQRATEGIYIDASSYVSSTGNRYVGIRIDRSKFNKEDISVNDIINYLVSNNFTIKYATEKPEIIELTDNISLCSYDKYTRIYSTNTLEPNIRCSIPYSIQTSIRSNNEVIKLIDGKLHRIESCKENNLTEYKVYGNEIHCTGTKNGFIDSLYIEGDTILNILRGNHLLPITNSGTYTDARYVINNESDRIGTYRIPAGTPVNVAVRLDVSEFTRVGEDPSLDSRVYPQLKIYYSDGEIGYADISNIKQPTHYYTFERKFVFSRDIEKIHLAIAARNCTTKVTLNQCAIVPGNINKSLLSFDNFSIPVININGVGFKKYYNEVTPYSKLNITSTGKNQFIPNRNNSLEPFDSYICYVFPEDANNIIVKAMKPERGCYTHFGENTTGKTLKFKCYVKGTGAINLKTPNNNIIYRTGLVTNKTVVFDITNKEYKIEFDVEGECDPVVEYRNIEIIEESQFDNVNFQPTTYDRKDLKTRSGSDITLYKIDDTYKDTIEKIDGNYYFVQRCNKISIGELGSCATATSQNGETTYLYQFKLPSDYLSIQGPGKSIIVSWCGHGITWEPSENEGVAINYIGDNIQVRIKSEKLNNINTNDAMKAWLVDNPIEVLYPLQAPIYHEMYNLDLQTFEGYTNIQTNSHVAHPTTSVVIDDNIQNALSVLVDKVTNMEEQLNHTDSAFLVSTLSSNHLDVLLSNMIDNK